MWTCPNCGHQFFQRNLWHSCGNFTVEGFLEGKSERAIELFWYFVNEYNKIGPIILHPVKTRIALMVQVRFAGVTKLGKDYIEGAFWSKEKVNSDKFYKISQLSPHDWGLHFRISDESFIDDEFRRYMKAAYAIGERQHLKGKSTRKEKHSKLQDFSAPR